MNAALLLEHYAQIADAPDAIARLRRFILDLAVRGKLVEQDPNDEPASELLKQIAVERARLVKAGEAQKGKDFSEAAEDAEFDLPQSWNWVRLGSITSYIQRGKSPTYAESDGLPVVSQKCVQWSGLNLGAARLITRQSLEKYEKIRFLQDGDLLWNSPGPGTIGRIIRVENVPDNLVCDSHVTVVRCLCVLSEYVRTWLRSGHVYGVIEDRAAGSTNQVELTAQMATNQVVPLPPLAEQHRIVAKVDELMALCDRLETAQAERETGRDKLTLSTLVKLNEPDPETFADDARFALEHLEPLTKRTDQIKQLRQTILNLAVRGKLVEQNPHDEPVAKTLAHLRAQRVKLEVDGKIQKSKRTDAVEENPFDVPAHWAFPRLLDICDVVDPNPSHRMPQYVREGGFPFISSENFVAEDKINFSIGKRVAESTIEDQKRRFEIFEGAFGFSRIGTIGKTRPLPTDRTYAISHAVCIINPLDLTAISMRYLRLAMTAEVVIRHAHGGVRSVGVPDLGMGVMRAMPIPFAPLAEQHRIVAKVDELISLCDQLEASLVEGEQTRSKLLEAVLHQALEPA